MRDGVVGVGSFEVESEGWTVRGKADAALQEGVRLHGGVACLYWSASHLRASETGKNMWQASGGSLVPSEVLPSELVDPAIENLVFRAT